MTTTYKQSDPATDHLLDFIAGGVPTNEYGESAGNYNAVFGDIDASDPLSNKTLAQIYQMQDQMLDENGISTATGRYQGLKGTIEEYQERKNLPYSTMFTEYLQDDFGLQKMYDRGYDDWISNVIGDDQFMHLLSCEWASLPDPFNDGKSHYDGDAAGNHASTSLAHFQAAVNEARELLDKRPGGFVLPQLPPNRAIRDIQRVLVRTGDLPRSGIDGDWGPQSQTALNQLANRDK